MVPRPGQGPGSHQKGRPPGSTRAAGGSREWQGLDCSHANLTAPPARTSPFSLLCPLLHPPGHSGLTCPCYHDTEPASHPWFTPHPGPHPPHSTTRTLSPPYLLLRLALQQHLPPEVRWLAPLGARLPRRWREAQLASLSHHQALPLNPGPRRGLPSVSPRWMLQ